MPHGMTQLADVGALYKLAGCDDDPSPSSGDEEQRDAVTHGNLMNSPATNSLIMSRVCGVTTSPITAPGLFKDPLRCITVHY